MGQKLLFFFFSLRLVDRYTSFLNSSLNSSRVSRNVYLLEDMRLYFFERFAAILMINFQSNIDGESVQNGKYVTEVHTYQTSFIFS